MANKILGLGSTVSVDAAGGSSYTAIPLVVSFVPPGREREEIDATVLADTKETFAFGIEKGNILEVDYYEDPDDATHTSLQTIFGSKAVAAWKLTYTDATPATKSFTGVVTKIDEQSIEKSKLKMNKLTVRVVGSITTA